MNNSYIETASRIGARIARDALWDGQRCNWFGNVSEQFGGRLCQGVGTLGPCIYDGTAGIGLFLGQLYRATDDRLYAHTAQAALEHALSRSGDIPTQVELGLHTGLFGIGYAAVQVGICTHSPSHVERGLDLLKQATQRDHQGRFVLDVMSGYAGTVGPLLALHKTLGHPWLLEGAVRAGELLLAASRRSERGISWDTTTELAQMVDLMGIPADLAKTLKPDSNRPHLTGLSHGSAGISWALLELASATGDARMLQAAEGGIAYEDSWFDAQNQQWRDLRCEHNQGGEAGDANTAWCHGASGIALTRLRGWQLTRDPRHMASLRVALRITADAIARNLAGKHNFSLCHGLAGDTEIFIRTASLLNDAASAALVRQVAEFGQAQYDQAQRPWPGGTHDRQESPGLMLGLAGTGYFYLCAAHPAGMPSILLPSLETTAAANA